MIAMSATLKMPVRSGPTPMFRKSTTLPRTKRSTQFDAPPARTRLVPIKSHPHHRKRTAAPPNVKSMTPVPSLNSAVRAEDGKLAPRLKNPPAFSTYSSRIVSAKYDRPGSPANAALATCLVTRSHPIVATTAIRITARTPILAIIFKSSAKSPRQTAEHIGDDLRHVGSESGPPGVWPIALLDSRPGWYIAPVTFTIEIEREDDGRWLAEVPALAGVMAYGQDRDEAVARVQALALRVIAERLEHREAPAEFLNVTFQAA